MQIAHEQTAEDEMEEDHMESDVSVGVVINKDLPPTVYLTLFSF
jgi:hypothetical protein